MNLHMKAYISPAITRPNAAISNVSCPLKMTHIRKNMIYMSYFPPNNFFLFIIWFSILAIMYLEESCVKMILCFYTVLAVSWRNGEDNKESIDRIRYKDCKKIKKPMRIIEAKNRLTNSE